ncbi:hypothetical protein PMF13cell1_00740 [Blautia producta]|uniref:Phage tail protein n=1 Tax=Blautia producta TaxID=33035 RepID=A0A4P6LTD1_9FIRM|nr:hypothetical protein [Blautia producta]QBE95226.1 hypothetical protein PMF13cell1_00740 [Blautia producta]
MAYEDIKSSGITESTPDNILFGAGTIHKGLVCDKETKKWNMAESIVGATSGGSKFSIKPEIKTIELDGALVRVAGLDVKQGETASMEINLAETTPEIIKAAVIGASGASTAEGYEVIESKSNIEKGDYWENIAFVGKTVNGRPIIVILENALCTSGLELEGKNKDAAVGKYTFECSQKLSGDHTKLPYHIYFPSAAASVSNHNQDEGGTE